MPPVISQSNVPIWSSYPTIDTPQGNSIDNLPVIPNVPEFADIPRSYLVIISIIFVVITAFIVTIAFVAIIYYIILLVHSLFTGFKECQSVQALRYNRRCISAGRGTNGFWALAAHAHFHIRENYQAIRRLRLQHAQPHLWDDLQNFRHHRQLVHANTAGMRTQYVRGADGFYQRRVTGMKSEGEEEARIDWTPNDSALTEPALDEPVPNFNQHERGQSRRCTPTETAPLIQNEDRLKSPTEPVPTSNQSDRGKSRGCTSIESSPRSSQFERGHSRLCTPTEPSLTFNQFEGEQSRICPPTETDPLIPFVNNPSSNTIVESQLQDAIPRRPTFSVLRSVTSYFARTPSTDQTPESRPGKYYRKIDGNWTDVTKSRKNYKVEGQSGWGHFDTWGYQDEFERPYVWKGRRIGERKSRSYGAVSINQTPAGQTLAGQRSYAASQSSVASQSDVASQSNAASLSDTASQSEASRSGASRCLSLRHQNVETSSMSSQSAISLIVETQAVQNQSRAVESKVGNPEATKQRRNEYLPNLDAPLRDTSFANGSLDEDASFIKNAKNQPPRTPTGTRIPRPRTVSCVPRSTPKKIPAITIPTGIPTPPKVTSSNSLASPTSLASPQDFKSPTTTRSSRVPKNNSTANKTWRR